LVQNEVQAGIFFGPACRQADWTISSFSLAANYYVKKDED
jgi:hypothetical protein